MTTCEVKMTACTYLRFSFFPKEARSRSINLPCSLASYHWNVIFPRTIRDWNKLPDSIVQALDSAINRSNHYQWISIRKTNCTIHWIEIYPVNSAIQPLNNRGQDTILPDIGYLVTLCPRFIWGQTVKSSKTLLHLRPLLHWGLLGEKVSHLERL